MVKDFYKAIDTTQMKAASAALKVDIVARLREYGANISNVDDMVER